ncbi:SpoIIE family protein phosphatase [Actinomadura sp. DC4]|uniref:SpoIIE family protein phosphatase n=1 Tax=Actinomadura sp. DC4 TaxID=3055069 RepID=UPI0025B0C9D7|nr:SpoIIE family protein phosphatase [Actinomadura sp. DC4]MDN3355200.1 SpoIIE family protein phosphatase [Actinomadura sp. DC4]
MGIPHDIPQDKGGESAEPAATVDQLRVEIEQLHAAAHTTAVLEQAKGLIAGRLGCGLAAAHTHLLEVARDSGVTPEVTARMLLTPEPGTSAARPAPGAVIALPGASRTPPAPPPGPAPPAAGDLCAQIEQTQRIGNLGWGLWDLVAGEIHWSDQLYCIFGRDPAEGPLPLDRLPEHVVPSDVPIVVHLVRTLLDGSEKVDNEIHILRGEETRDVRLMGEPVLDTFGVPVAVRCVCQDVTRWRLGERTLKASRVQLERRLIAAERHQAIEMQRSILPLPEGIVTKPGLRAAVRYLPAGHSARVGGDWYETTAIEGDGVFLAIGDVSGHGLQAAAAMARLRNGLSGLAFSGAEPDRLLGWLNRLTMHWPTSLTATVLAGRYDPEERTLTWSQAGHLPPVLVRDGKAVTLEPPEGVLLGAMEAPEFAVETTSLEAGDLLLLYTDGLVERRERGLQDGLDLLIHAASTAACCDPDSVLDHILDIFGGPNPDDDTCVVAIRIE